MNAKQRDKLLEILKARFEKNMHRHKGIGRQPWSDQLMCQITKEYPPNNGPNSALEAHFRGWFRDSNDLRGEGIDPPSGNIRRTPARKKLDGQFFP